MHVMVFLMVSHQEVYLSMSASGYGFGVIEW
jgi:hypothetical protein